jgi:hypothetical protein
MRAAVIEPEPFEVSQPTRPTWRSETFLAALRAYLQERAFNTATHQQLWQAFDDYTGVIGWGVHTPWHGVDGV